MKNTICMISLCFLVVLSQSCNFPVLFQKENNAKPTDLENELSEYIASIKAIDNHAHPNSIDPNDKGSDALPLDGFGPIQLPVRVRPESQVWLDASKSIYGFSGTQLTEDATKELINTIGEVMKQKGEKFPEWALDQAGIDIMLANRIFMGPGLTSSRFRWVAYVDALLFPLSTKSEAKRTPDREKLFPMEDEHLKEFLASLKLSKLPSTLDEYLKLVVTPTLESEKDGGCIAVKFEASYLRSLNFDKVAINSAREVYSHYINGGEPSHENYKLLQDFIFRYLAGEAGRLGMAVHIHSLTGVGDYFVAAGCDPLLLEPVFNDPELRKTNFVIIHGGGIFYEHTGSMLWKPNVYTDISLLTQLWTPEHVAVVLRDWLSQFPEKVLFGTDAVSFGPGLGWEMSAWVAASSGRQALKIALSGMVKSNEISLIRAKEIAKMVLRTNAVNLYNLGIK
jgi:uncharacterized protein